VRSSTSTSTGTAPVHLYGRPADMGAISDICARAGVPILEDAAQAHGARLDGGRAGALGAAAGFSFYPTKNLGAMGDGGAVTTDDARIAEVVRSLRHHGAEPDNANRHVRPGGTWRLDNLQAALLRLKLPLLDAWNEERRRAADRYGEALSGLPLRLPAEDPPGGTQVFHLYVVELDDRDRVVAELRQDGIGAAIHYPTPAHLQPAWRELAAGEGSFPVAERLAERALSLPIFPGITDAQIERVTERLGAALR
jgi:dTDP-4-amino-4,6-dideoxygalactose transaminase